VCGVTLFVLLAFHGAEMVRSEFRSGMTTYSMALPMWIFGMALPVCAVVLIFRTVQKAVEDWKAISSGKGLPDEACPPEAMSE
jgi:TRAP-type C4-dicarboxylate transport system permease small subunit